MNDLTVVFLTENKLSKKWVNFHKKTLLEAVADNDLITISRKPLNIGKSLNLIQKEPSSLVNIYRQMLRGFKKAKTKFVAVAEDDTLYCPDHFNNLGFRIDNKFAYNLCNWKLFNWGAPTYHWTGTLVNYTLTAPRDLAIEALEERFDSGWKEGDIVGELGRRRIERKLGVTHKPVARVWSTVPVVNINHDKGFDEYAKRHRKRMGFLRSFDLPHWGKAENIIKKWA